MDQYIDALDDTVTAEVIDNGDGQHAVVNLFGEGGTVLGIALTGEQARDMADALRTIAAGLDY